MPTEPLFPMDPLGPVVINNDYQYAFVVGLRHYLSRDENKLSLLETIRQRRPDAPHEIIIAYIENQKVEVAKKIKEYEKRHPDKKALVGSSLALKRVLINITKKDEF